MAQVVIFEIAISSDYPDGGVSVTIPSYSDNLRPKDDTDDALLQRTVDLSVLGRRDSKGNPICKDGVYHIVDEAVIPTDRGFRAAWIIDNNQVIVSMDKARVIHMDAIRVARDAQLASLDVPWMKAVEAGDTDAQATIATEKQTLRDIPATFDITTDVVTPAQLRGRWPAELPVRE